MIPEIEDSSRVRQKGLGPDAYKQASRLWSTFRPRLWISINAAKSDHEGRL